MRLFFKEKHLSITWETFTLLSLFVFLPVILYTIFKIDDRVVLHTAREFQYYMHSGHSRSNFVPNQTTLVEQFVVKHNWRLTKQDLLLPVQFEPRETVLQRRRMISRAVTVYLQVNKYLMRSIKPFKKQGNSFSMSNLCCII